MKTIVAVVIDETVKSSLCALGEAFRICSDKGIYIDRNRIHLSLTRAVGAEEEEKLMRAIDMLPSERFELVFDELNLVEKPGGFMLCTSFRQVDGIDTVLKSLAMNLSIVGLGDNMLVTKPHITIAKGMTLKNGVDPMRLLGEISDMKMQVERVSMLRYNERGNRNYREIYYKELV